MGDNKQLYQIRVDNADDAIRTLAAASITAQQRGNGITVGIRNADPLAARKWAHTLTAKVGGTFKGIVEDQKAIAHAFFNEVPELATANRPPITPPEPVAEPEPVVSSNQRVGGDNAARFALLFNGNPRSRGQYTEDRTKRSDKGKMGGKALTIEGPTMPAHWDAHLSGRAGLGAVAILDDGTCHFAAIDFDVYDEPTVKRFVTDAKRSGFPLVWCKSKSGGAHLYVFFSSPADVAKVRAKLRALAGALGYPNIEIFPKQERLDVAKGEQGNWINLPYFNAAQTQRYGFGDDGRPIADPAAWLTYAESKRVDPADFLKLDAGQAEIPFSDAPPCIQTMAHNGVTEGGRNKALFQFALYAKKKYDDWQEHVLVWNDEYFSPSLPFKEVQATVFKSLEADREYGYLCKDPVCQEVCNKPLCQTREFGVMGGLVQVWEDWEIDNIVILIPQAEIDGLTDKYVAMDINGKRFVFTFDELGSNALFRAKVVKGLYKHPPRMNAAMWDQMYQHWLSQATEVENDEDPVALAWTWFEAWVSSAPELSDVRLGPIHTEDDHIAFTMEPFLLYVSSLQRGRTLTPKQWAELFKFKGGRKQSMRLAGDGNPRWVWVVPSANVDRSALTMEPAGNHRSFKELIEF